MFYRASIYDKFITKMNLHNNDNSQTWKMGVNEFSDITE